MIRDYIDEKIKNNELQFSILDKEYQSVRKNEYELKDQIRRIQLDDNIDFLIFSPRGSQYSTKSHVIEYDRRLKKVVSRKDELRAQMNILLEKKIELEKLAKENQEENQQKILKDNEEKIQANKNIVDITKNISEGINSCIDRISMQEVMEPINKKKEQKNSEINNWNEKGSIKIKSNGNTGKFFDALASRSEMIRKNNIDIKNKGLNSIMDGINKIDLKSKEVSINLNTTSNNIKETKESLVSEIGFDNKNIISNANLDVSKPQIDYNLKIDEDIENSGGLLVEDTMKMLKNNIVEKKKNKIINNDDMAKIIKKIELCQKLLASNKEQCDVELKNLKYVLENIN